jgi:hypothetical protein
LIWSGTCIAFEMPLLSLSLFMLAYIPLFFPSL